MRETGGAILEQLKAIGARLRLERAPTSPSTRASRRAVREVFVAAVREGPHLPRQLHHQLVPALPHRPLQRGGGEGGGRRAALAPALSARATAAGTSPWPPPGPRRCWATPPWRCIPRTSATRPGRHAACALPLVDRRIPIVADEAVDPAFGTGAVKVTPAHDPLDFEIGRRHDLPSIDVMTPEARISRDGARAIPGARPLRGAQARWWRSSRRPGCSRRSSRTATRWATATAATRWSSRGSPTSGSCGWSRSRSPRSQAYRDGDAPLHPRAAGRGLRPVDGGHPRLVHLAPALVGPPDPGLVLRASAAAAPRVSRDRPARLSRLRRPGAPGRGRARHLVLLLAGAVLAASAGPTGRRTSRASIPATRSSPRPRSSSSGWRGW